MPKDNAPTDSNSWHDAALKAMNSSIANIEKNSEKANLLPLGDGQRRVICHAIYEAIRGTAVTCAQLVQSGKTDVLMEALRK